MKNFVILILMFNLFLLGCDKVEKYNLFKKVFKSKRTIKQEQFVNTRDTTNTIKVDTNNFISSDASEKSFIESKSLVTEDKGIFMITGAFLIPLNAERYVEALKEKGYNAFIIKGHDGFNMVAVETYPDLKSALRDLNKYRSEIHPDAWIHIKRY